MNPHYEHTLSIGLSEEAKQIDMSRDRKEEREEMDLFRAHMESSLAKAQEENVSKEKRIQELTRQLQDKTKRLEVESKELILTTDKSQQQLQTNQQQKGEM